MKSILNLTIVEGYLLDDPDLSYTKNNIPLCRFNISIRWNFKFKDQEFNEYSFLSVNSWNKTALAVAKYLKKGCYVRIRGRLRRPKDFDKNLIIIDAIIIEYLGIKKGINNKKNILIE